MRGLFLTLSVGLVCLSAACSDAAAIPARRVIVETHAKEVQSIVKSDVERHLRGVAQAGERLAKGFLVEDPIKREAQMRTALVLVGKPPRGIVELVASARSFLAAVDLQGKVFALDAKKEKDRMSGFDAGAHFKVVKRALAGETNYGIEVFPPIEGGAEGSTSLVFAAPAKRGDAVVGVVMTGIPLWKLSQRITRQIQLDHVSEGGAILWVYLYRGDKLHHFGTPPDLDTVVPDGATRRAGLAQSQGGFTGQLMQFGRDYAYGVLPLPRIGDDVGAVIFRSDPID